MRGRRLLVNFGRLCLRGMRRREFCFRRRGIELCGVRFPSIRRGDGLFGVYSVRGRPVPDRFWICKVRGLRRGHVWHRHGPVVVYRWVRELLHGPIPDRDGRDELHKLRSRFVLNRRRGEFGVDLHIVRCGHLPNCDGRYGLHQLLGRHVLKCGWGSFGAGLHAVFGRHLPVCGGRIGVHRMCGGHLVGRDRVNNVSVFRVRGREVRSEFRRVRVL